MRDCNFYFKNTLENVSSLHKWFALCWHKQFFIKVNTALCDLFPQRTSIFLLTSDPLLLIKIYEREPKSDWGVSLLLQIVWHLNKLGIHERKLMKRKNGMMVFWYQLVLWYQNPFEPDGLRIHNSLSLFLSKYIGWRLPEWDCCFTELLWTL